VGQEAASESLGFFGKRKIGRQKTQTWAKEEKGRRQKPDRKVKGGATAFDDAVEDRRNENPREGAGKTITP